MLFFFLVFSYLGSIPLDVSSGAGEEHKGGLLNRPRNVGAQDRTSSSLKPTSRVWKLRKTAADVCGTVPPKIQCGSFMDVVKNDQQKEVVE